jgi:NADH-quinone oxidoreductase subunit C
VNLSSRLGHVLPDAAVDSAHGVVTADVVRERWVDSVRAVRDDEEIDGSFFDVLLVVDQLPGGFDVVVRLWSVARRQGVHLRTTCPRDDPRVPSLVGVFAGASWHERQAAEMFGVAFAGHPDLRPLLLPQGGVALPLRKEHLLAARAELSWPGAEDPAFSGAGGRPPRRRLSPPGAPS